MLKLTPITYVPVCVNMCVCMCECNLPSLLVFIAIERGNHKRITTTKKTLYISESMAGMFLTTYLSC